MGKYEKSPKPDGHSGTWMGLFLAGNGRGGALVGRTNGGVTPLKNALCSHRYTATGVTVNLVLLLRAGLPSRWA